MSRATLRILAVEDDPVQAMSISLLIQTLGYELVGVAASAPAALQCFDAEQPDLVLLDINIAGPADGIELAHQLVKRRPVPLIFLTAYPDQHTFERARRVGPFAFLGKPYNELLLGHSIELAVQHFAAAQRPAGSTPEGAVLLDGVFVREAGRLLKVSFAELLVAEADDSYTHLHTASHKYTLRSSLRELEKSLPPGRFLRIHRGYLVQASQVTAFDPQTVFIGAHRLPLGRAYRDGVRARLPQLR